LECIAGSFGVAMGSSAVLPLAKVRTMARLNSPGMPLHAI